MGFRTRLFILTLGVVLLTLVSAYLYLARQARQDATNRARHEMEVRLALVELAVKEEQAPLDNLSHWDAVADELGSTSRSRITLVRLDGVVIGDSDVPLGRLPSVENHGQRPEVLQAQANGTGQNTRISSTIGQEMLYLAKRWQRGDSSVGTVRISVQLAEVASSTQNLYRQLTFAGLLGLLVAFVGSSLMAHITTTSARRLTAVAQKMAAGELNARGDVQGTDEFATLAETLNGLAANLSTTLAELRAEGDRLTRVLSSMQEGVLLIDQEGRVQLLNGAAKEMLLLGSHAKGELASRILTDAELVRLLETSLREGETSSAELQIGPTARKVLTNVHPLRQSGGALAVLVDITDLRRLETIRQEFVANASHELRTPVTAIVSAIETLEGPAAGDAEATKLFTDIIARNARRLSALVNDLLELSQLESEQFTVECVATPLRQLAEGTLTSFLPSARQKEIELISLIPTQCLVMANAKGLEYVLVNLVQNAINYCPAGSRVTVSSRNVGQNVEVSVKDNGPGIAKEHLDRLFERFYRVDTGRSRSVGGTGLGLSIVRHWMEAMSGSVRVSSEVGKGTTFFVTLAAPSAAGANPVAANPTTAPSPDAASTRPAS